MKKSVYVAFPKYPNSETATIILEEYQYNKLVSDHNQYTKLKTMPLIDQLKSGNKNGKSLLKAKEFFELIDEVKMFEFNTDWCELRILRTFAAFKHNVIMHDNIEINFNKLVSESTYINPHNNKPGYITDETAVVVYVDEIKSLIC